VTREAANPAFYDLDAATYDAQRWTGPGGRYTNRVQLAIVEDLCAAWHDRRILEIGPGTGRFTIPLARRSNRLTLLDVSPGMLEQARSNLEAAELGDRVEAYVEGSVYALPFDDGEFDHALALNVFNHLERPGAALCELARVIHAGSTLLFNYANLHSWYFPAGRRVNRRATAIGQSVYSSWRRPSEVDAMIEQAGLEPVCRRGHVHVPRALERFHLHALVKALDAASRRGPLLRLAPVQFCLCRKRSDEATSRQGAGGNGGGAP
jgi:SAM-dependent methyltransferase